MTVSAVADLLIKKIKLPVIKAVAADGGQY
jgi:hypothetical protein